MNNEMKKVDIWLKANGLVINLEKTRFIKTFRGCHMSCRITGVLAYTDDITLLAQSKSALSIMFHVGEQYAPEFHIFNGSKSIFSSS